MISVFCVISIPVSLVVALSAMLEEARLTAATAGQPAVTSEDGGGTMDLEARSPVVAIATKSLSQAQTARLVAAEGPTTPGRSVYANFGAWTLVLSWASYNMYHMCGCIESKLAGVASGASTTCSILLLLNNIMVLKRCAGGFAGGSARGPMRPALPWPPPPSPPPLSDSTKPGGWDINFILMTLAAIYTTYLMVTECGCDEGKLAAFMNGLAAVCWLQAGCFVVLGDFASLRRYPSGP